MNKKNIIITASISAVLLIGVYFVLIKKNSNTADSGSISSIVSNPNSTYKDGTYTASASYQVPRDTNTLNATITLVNDTITKISTTSDYNSGESRRYTSGFASSISNAVKGKKISDSKVSVVGGASLTSMAFNDVIDSVISKAKK